MSRITPVGSPAREPKASLYAPRPAIYPKGVSGIARDIKWAVLLFCLTVYYTLPWVRWDRGPDRPTQAVLLDMNSERFHFFSLELWPQDIYFLTGALILGAVGLFRLGPIVVACVLAAVAARLRVIRSVRTLPTLKAEAVTPYSSDEGVEV